ncbi:MAG: glycosyltransferase family 2 protein [Paracoccaceae bacterium]
MRLLAVLTVRNEAAFLLEWLAHHQAAGFTDFLVMSNDCDDGTDAMLDRLQAPGALAHLPNPAPHDGGVQWAALKRAGKHPLLERADWILALDIDEFVNVHVGAHQISDLLHALPEASAITLTWRLFGNAGVQRYEDTPVCEQFCRAAPRIMNWPWRASMFKTLYKNDGIYAKPGVHRPRSPDGARLHEARWFDGSGRMLDDRFRRQQLFSPFGRDNYQLAQLNHYPLGAMESYIVKCDRGRAVHGADALGMSYWVERNWNQHEDSSVLALQAARNAHLRDLHDDAELHDLHERAVAWRKARFEILMQDEPNRALFGRLLMTPASSVLATDDARILHRFAQKSRNRAD